MHTWLWNGPELFHMPTEVPFSDVTVRSVGPVAFVTVISTGLVPFTVTGAPPEVPSRLNRQFRPCIRTVTDALVGVFFLSYAMAVSVIVSLSIRSAYVVVLTEKSHSIAMVALPVAVGVQVFSTVSGAAPLPPPWRTSEVMPVGSAAVALKSKVSPGRWDSMSMGEVIRRSSCRRMSVQPCRSCRPHATISERAPSRNADRKWVRGMPSLLRTMTP